MSAYRNVIVRLGMLGFLVASISALGAGQSACAECNTERTACFATCTGVTVPVTTCKDECQQTWVGCVKRCTES